MRMILALVLLLLPVRVLAGEEVAAPTPVSETTPAKKPYCPEVHVLMNGRHLLLPKIPGLALAYNREVIDFRKYPCSDETPIEIDRFQYPAGKLLRTDSPVGPVMMFGTYHPEVKVEDAFYDELAESGKKIEELPVKEGFYEWRSPHHYEYFIPTDKTFISPNNKPVIFRCLPYSGGPLHCTFAIAWKNKIKAGLFQISIEKVSKSDWKKLYQKFLTVIEEIDTSKETLTLPKGN